MLLLLLLLLLCVCAGAQPCVSFGSRTGAVLPVPRQVNDVGPAALDVRLPRSPVGPRWTKRDTLRATEARAAAAEAALAVSADRVWHGPRRGAFGAIARVDLHNTGMALVSGRPATMYGRSITAGASFVDASSSFGTLPASPSAPSAAFPRAVPHERPIVTADAGIGAPFTSFGALASLPSAPHALPLAPRPETLPVTIQCSDIGPAAYVMPSSLRETGPRLPPHAHPMPAAARAARARTAPARAPTCAWWLRAHVPCVCVFVCALRACGCGVCVCGVCVCVCVCVLSE